MIMGHPTPGALWPLLTIRYVRGEAIPGREGGRQGKVGGEGEKNIMRPEEGRVLNGKEGGEGRLCNYLAAEAAVFFLRFPFFHFLKGREVGVVGRRGERRNLQRFFAL